MTLTYPRGETSDPRQHERVLNRSKRSMRLLFGFLRLTAPAFAVAFILVGSVGRAADLVGEAAPPLALAKTLQGPEASAVHWGALKGKVVVIDFWATWCGPCIASIPHWNELTLAFKEKPVVFLAITDENEDVVSTFLKRTPIHSWIGIDGVGRPMREIFGVNGIPTTFIVNQAGVVAAITHPAKLQPRDIDEVIETGKSSLPPPDQRITDIEPELEMVSPHRPLVELSVRRSGPRRAGGAFIFWEGSGSEISGKHAPVKSAIVELFGGRETLLDCRTPLPIEKYDFTVRLPATNPRVRDPALTAMFRAAFGLQILPVESECDVYVMTAVSTNARGRVASGVNSRGGGGEERGGLRLGRSRFGSLPDFFERQLRKPVLDETGDTNLYDIRLRWKMSSRELLLSTVDGDVLDAVLEPGRDAEKALNPDQRRQVDFVRGSLPEAESQKIPNEEHQALLLLQAEMLKADEDRFLPDAEAVIAAVDDQLGLKLTTARRVLRKLIVEAAPIDD